MVECPYCNCNFCGQDGLDHFDYEIERLDNKMKSCNNSAIFLNTLTLLLARRRLLEMQMEKDKQ